MKGGQHTGNADTLPCTIHYGASPVQAIFRIGPYCGPSSHSISEEWYSGYLASALQNSHTGLSPSLACRSRQLLLNFQAGPRSIHHIPAPLLGRFGLSSSLFDRLLAIRATASCNLEILSGCLNPIISLKSKMPLLRI